MYKICYKNVELFFNESNCSVFNPYKTALKFIEKNRGKSNIKLYYKDLHSRYNFGWKLLGNY